MSNFSFGNISANSRKQALNLKVHDSPVLLDKSQNKAKYDLPLVILVEDQFEPRYLGYIDKWLASNGCTKYIILNVLACEWNEKEAKEGLIKFYKNNRSKFMDYVPQFAPILTSGPALYGLLQEDDLYPNHMEQILFGKSNFWFTPDLTRDNCHRVFPMASIRDDIFGFSGYGKWCTGAVDSYKTKLASLQISNAIKGNPFIPPRFPKLNKIFIRNAEEFDTLFYEPNKDRHDEVLAWDLETSGLNFIKDTIGCITLSFDGITGYYIPWRLMDEDIKRKLGSILKNNRQLGANLKFDVKFLWRNGVPEAQIDEDIILMGHTLDETRSNSLKALAFLYSEFGGYERPLDQYKEKLGKKRDEINYLEIPEDTLRDYAIMDAIVTRRVWDNILDHCRELDSKYPNEFSDHGFEYYYRTFRVPAARTYAKMEYLGVFIDKGMLNDVRNQMKEAINELKKKLGISFGVPMDFQWESGQKLGKLLEKKGWEDWGRTSTGELATGDFQISRWKKTHPEAAVLEQLKSFNTLLNTFVGEDTKNSLMAEFLGENDEEGDKGWTQYIQYHKEDGTWRMHPNFLAMMTDSGRSRCNSPNMQQVPTRGKFAKEIKSCLKTPDDENYYLCTVDYSSLQMRIAAIDIRDVNDPLVKILQEGAGVDLHSNTAYNTFYVGKEVDIDIITVEQDGQTYEFLGGQTVMTDHGEKFAVDLREDDTLIVG